MAKISAGSILQPAGTRRPVDLLIFDLDGTLVDTRRDLANSVNHVLAQLGLRTLTLTEVMQNVGNGMTMLLQRSLPNGEHNRIPEAVALFRQHYGNHLLVHSHLYPGVDAVLHHFTGKRLSVISNKPEGFTREILQGLKILHHFEIVLGGDSLPTFKPSPEPILHVLKTLDVAPARTVIVGDSPPDIQAGRAAAILTCAVTYGFRGCDFVNEEKPDFVVDELAQILAFFE